MGSKPPGTELKKVLRFVLIAVTFNSKISAPPIGLFSSNKTLLSALYFVLQGLYEIRCKTVTFDDVIKFSRAGKGRYCRMAN